MGKVFNTVASLTASAISRSNRKKALKKINRVNEANRNVAKIGRVSSDQIIPSSYPMGNLCITGGTQEVRNALVVQNCMQSCSVGVPTIVLHEGNHHLEHDLGAVCGSQYYFRLINSAHPYYDPIFRLSDNETATTIVNAALPEHKIDTAGVLYLGALSKLLRKRGITPYIRMLASCPHNNIQSVVQNEEQAGHITAAEATAIRNDIAAGDSARASVEYFFSQLQGESSIIAWKSHLSRCTSIAECVRSGGIMAIDIGSTNKRTQLSLIAAEIEKCVMSGTSLRVIVDATSLLSNEKLRNLLKNSSGSLAWTLSCPDVSNMVSSTREELSSWLAMAHKTVLFSHSVRTAQMLSSELGEYDHIEVTQSHAGNNGIGQFGFHFGVNNNVSTTNKRERVVKPEEIENLAEREFILLDNNTATIHKGILS